MSTIDDPKLRKRLLKHLREEVYCKVSASKISGVGVFAIRAIPKDINPFKGSGPCREIRVSTAEVRSLPHRVRGLIDMYCYFDKETVLIPESGLNRMDVALYVNHSTNPNLIYLKNGSLKTKRAIKVGEELTLNYDASFGGTHVF